MRENREAASSLGLNIAELRFGAFVLSAAYGGAAGALMAHVIHVVSPENLDLALMVTCLTMTVIGGRTQIAGAILGACLIVYLRERFRVLENYYMIAYGSAALAVLDSGAVRACRGNGAAAVSLVRSRSLASAGNGGRTGVGRHRARNSSSQTGGAVVGCRQCRTRVRRR